MAEIKRANDDAADEPETIAIRTTEPAPLHTAVEPSTDAVAPNGGPERSSDEADSSGDEAEKDSAGRRFVGSTPFLIFVALAVAILVKTFVIQAFYIPSESMVPTLEVGDRVFVSKFMFDGGDVARGDVIVFENPNPGELPDRSGVSSVLHWLGEGIGLAQLGRASCRERVLDHV